MLITKIDYNINNEMGNNNQSETTNKLIKALEKQVAFLERENERLSRELNKSPKENQDFIND